MKSHETETKPTVQTHQAAADLALIAALAAISFDSAIEKRAVDLDPVRQLAELLRGGSKLEESAKKALARIAKSSDRDVNAARPAGAPGSKDESQSTGAIEKLSIAARADTSKLNRNDLVELRDFCLRLSIWARTPRPVSPLRLR